MQSLAPADDDDPNVTVAYGRLGRTLRGKWTLEAVRGVGGMATVYAARHRNGARVAVKILHPRLNESEELRARFAREAYLSNRIDHPGVVRVIDDDVDEVDGCAFLVMDLVEGRALDDPALPTFDDGRLLDVAEQVLEVLVAAHAHGIVHRDLKPANLLLDGAGRIHVVDFGIARLLDDEDTRRPLTRDGTTCGTPGFVAPEQALGRRHLITGQTDLFSLGATLFYLASHDCLHGDGTPQELIIRVATEPSRSIDTVAPHLDARTVAIVDRATMERAEDRWPSAEIMLRAVRMLRASLAREARNSMPHDAATTGAPLTRSVPVPAMVTESPPPPTHDRPRLARFVAIAAAALCAVWLLAAVRAPVARPVGAAAAARAPAPTTIDATRARTAITAAARATSEGPAATVEPKRSRPTPSATATSHAAQPKPKKRTIDVGY